MQNILKQRKTLHVKCVVCSRFFLLLSLSFILFSCIAYQSIIRIYSGLPSVCELSSLRMLCTKEAMHFCEVCHSDRFFPLLIIKHAKLCTEHQPAHCIHHICDKNIIFHFLGNGKYGFAQALCKMESCGGFKKIEKKILSKFEFKNIPKSTCHCDANHLDGYLS